MNSIKPADVTIELTAGKSGLLTSNAKVFIKGRQIGSVQNLALFVNSKDTLVGMELIFPDPRMRGMSPQLKKSIERNIKTAKKLGISCKTVS